MTKNAVPAALSAVALTTAILLTSACGQVSTSAHSGARATTVKASNTTEVCQTVVKESNLGAARTGSARTEASRDAEWAKLIASTRASAAKATDVNLKQDLVLVADGMTRVASRPGGLREGMDELEKADPAYFAAVNAASDRVEAVCGRIDGVV